DAGELSKPANTLVECIRDATGVLFEPHRIRRKARADAEAKVLAAKADIETDELYRRALHRLASEEAKKQENIENIMEGALPNIADSADPEKVDKDWLSNFIDKIKTISDEDVQEVWSKILSGETNTPGSYSKKTINILHELDKSDAEMINKLFRFMWVSGEPMVLVFDVRDEIYNKNGINFETLKHLSSIGLIYFDNLTSYSRDDLKGIMTASYYGRKITLDIGGKGNGKISLGRVMLTKIGVELASLSNSSSVDGFYEYVLSKWEDIICC
ncbi:MAG: DUF2806 domain-containing protein, partial [Hyphomicrobiales bacterium]